MVEKLTAKKILTIPLLVPLACVPALILYLGILFFIDFHTGNGLISVGLAFSITVVPPLLATAYVLRRRRRNAN